MLIELAVEAVVAQIVASGLVPSEDDKKELLVEFFSHAVRNGFVMEDPMGFSYDSEDELLFDAVLQHRTRYDC